MDAQRIAVDAVVALTECDRDTVAAFIRRFYLAGVKDPKRLTFKGLKAMARGRSRQLLAFTPYGYAAAAIDLRNPAISARRLVVESDKCLAEDKCWLEAAP